MFILNTVFSKKTYTLICIYDIELGFNCSQGISAIIGIKDKSEKKINVVSLIPLHQILQFCQFNSIQLNSVLFTASHHNNGHL